MTSFEAGFLSFLSECGLPQKQASHILERAVAHPAAQELLKSSQDVSGVSWAELDDLNNTYQQHAYDTAMSDTFNRLHS